MIELSINETVKLTISKTGEKYVIEVQDPKGKKIVSFLDSWENPVSSAFLRAKIRNEILKYFPVFSEDELDRKLMQAVIANRDALAAL